MKIKIKPIKQTNKLTLMEDQSSQSDSNKMVSDFHQQNNYLEEEQYREPKKKQLKIIKQKKQLNEKGQEHLKNI